MAMTHPAKFKPTGADGWNLLGGCCCSCCLPGGQGKCAAMSSQHPAQKNCSRAKSVRTPTSHAISHWAGCPERAGGPLRGPPRARTGCSSLACARGRAWQGRGGPDTAPFENHYDCALCTASQNNVVELLVGQSIKTLLSQIAGDLLPTTITREACPIL